jgi:hypothetical protein
MWDKFKNALVEWIKSVLKGILDLLKRCIVGIMLFLFFITIPIICFWLFHKTMPGFGFLSYVGGLFIFIGLLIIMGIIVDTFQNWFYVAINKWGVKTNEKTHPFPSLKEVTFIFTIVFLFVIAGALLMILEILMKSR